MGNMCCKKKQKIPNDVQLAYCPAKKQKILSGVRVAFSHTEDIVECDEEEENIGYDDIGGMREGLTKIKTMLMLLLHPDLCTTVGIKPPFGVLIYGPHGVGKSMIAKAMCNEKDVYVHLINGPKIMSMRGKSKLSLRQAFHVCKKNSPAVLLIDEIDYLVPTFSRHRMDKLLPKLMDELKESNARVAVMGITNKLSAIDTSLRRLGRFDHEISIGFPNAEERLEILKIHTKRMKLSDDVNLKQIASETHGFVGSELYRLCTEAAMENIREKIDYDDPTKVIDTMAITQEDFKAALSKIKPATLRATAVVETKDLS